MPATYRADGLLAVDTFGRASTSAVVTGSLATGSNAPITLIPTASAWKYLDDGSDQEAPGSHLVFNDNIWKIGKAELGYGDAAEGRPSNCDRYGPDAAQKWVTYYFRRAFSVSQAASLQDLILDLLRDDGAIVYLNGEEVFRSNMPEGPVNYLTLNVNTSLVPKRHIFSKGQ
jgi:hypothetical protein